MTNIVDAHYRTNFCENALNGKCPLEKVVACCKGSHDICLSGEYKLDVDTYGFFLIDEQERKDERRKKEAEYQSFLDSCKSARRSLFW